MVNKNINLDKLVVKKAIVDKISGIIYPSRKCILQFETEINKENYDNVIGELKTNNYFVFLRNFGTKSILFLTKLNEKDYYAITVPIANLNTKRCELSKLKLYPIQSTTFCIELYEDTLLEGTYSKLFSKTDNNKKIDCFTQFCVEDVHLIAGKKLSQNTFTANNRINRLEDFKKILNDPDSVTIGEEFNLKIIQIFKFTSLIKTKIQQLIIDDQINRNIEKIIFMNNETNEKNKNFFEIINEEDFKDDDIFNQSGNELINIESIKIVYEKFIMERHPKSIDIYYLIKWNDPHSKKILLNVIPTNRIKYKSWFENEDDLSTINKKGANKKIEKIMVLCKKNSDMNWYPIEPIPDENLE